MKPYLDKRGHAYIEVALQGKKQDIKLNCLIDTGFSGGISIPREYQDKFNFPRIVRDITWELADGSETKLDIYLGKLNIAGGEREIAVIFDGKDGLVGIEFLKEKIFTLNLKDNLVELTD